MGLAMKWRRQVNIDIVPDKFASFCRFSAFDQHIKEVCHCLRLSQGNEVINDKVMINMELKT